MTTIIIAFLLLICCSLSAQTFSDEALYKCYLGEDKELWKQYITTADWNKLTSKERQRLLNYEYGYIAYAVSENNSESKKLLDNFNSHIESMTGKMAESTRLVYLSAAASYSISLSKWTIAVNGPKTFNYAEKALAIDSLNPLALTLRGSIYFYSPKAFGGDKQLALKYMQQAEKQFQQRGDTVNNWNYRSVQMILAQCLEKTGNKQAAIAKCRSILQEEPEFSYIRDCYLPELLGQKGKGNNQNIVGASIVNGIMD